VRVRITRSRSGEVDGVDLADFEVGITYNLPAALASYLVVTLSAEFVEDTEAVRPETQLFRGVPPPPSIAADDGHDDEN
jgi:hypothetical protein